MTCGIVAGNEISRSSHGVTFIELVVVVAIMAVLTALAVPSYQRYVQRGHRADAIRVLLEMAACQERVRAEAAYYDTNRCVENSGSAHYQFSFEPEGQSQTLAFRAIASPNGSAGEDGCGDLELDHTGNRGIGGSEDRLMACWGGR